MFFSRRISCVVGSRKALGRTPRISKRARCRRWTPTVAVEQLETRQLLSATVAGAAVTTPAVTSAADPPPAPTITVPAPENNIQRGPMGFTVDSNGNVAIVGPGTGTVLGAVNSSGFVNVTGVTLGADGISGTFSFTGQIVVAGGQASLTNGTYTATYSWGGAAWQTQVGSSPSDQPASPPPVATGSGTWNVPSFALTNSTVAGVAKYAGTYIGSYVGTINTVIFSSSTFANDPITLTDSNPTPSANDTLLIQSNNADSQIYVAPGTTGVTNDGTNSVKVTGTLAQLQAAVNGLIYVPPSLESTSPFHVSDLVNLSLTDGGDSEQATASEPVTSFQTPTISFAPPPPISRRHVPRLRSASPTINRWCSTARPRGLEPATVPQSSLATIRMPPTSSLSPSVMERSRWRREHSSPATRDRPRPSPSPGRRHSSMRRWPTGTATSCSTRPTRDTLGPMPCNSRWRTIWAMAC